MKFEEWLSQQDGVIEVDCGCVTAEAFYHWMRVAYEAGNSPVVPMMCRYSKRQLKNVKRATQLMSMHGIMAFWS